MKHFDVEKAFEENRVCTFGIAVPQHNLVAYYMQCIVDEDFFKALAKAEKLTEFKKRVFRNGKKIFRQLFSRI